MNRRNEVGTSQHIIRETLPSKCRVDWCWLRTLESFRCSSYSNSRG